MRFAFVTCVKVGLECMDAIYKSGFKLDLAITLSDDVSKAKSGRVFIDDFCKSNEIYLVKTQHINSLEILKYIKDFQIDWLFIIGWSQIANEDIIKAPNIGAIGAHPTLLPKGRGRAPIPWTILKGLNETGVTFFKLNEEIDTGSILLQKKIKLQKNESATTLYQKVCKTHSEMMPEIINLIMDNKLKEVKQNHLKSSYWPGRKPSDGLINLKGSVTEAEILIRATTRPYPGAYFFEFNEKIIVWSAKIVSNNFPGRILKFKDGNLLLIDITKVKI